MPLFTFTGVPTMQLNSNLQQHAKMYYFNGVMLILLGMFALISPLVAATFLDLLIGCLFLITGLVQAGFSFATKRNWTYYVTAAIAIIAGMLMLLKPAAGILALGLIVLAFLVMQGVLQILSSALYSGCKGWGWLLFSGIISLLLAGIVFSSWPISATWILGVMIGVNFIAFGASLIMLTKYVNN